MSKRIIWLTGGIAVLCFLGLYAVRLKLNLDGNENLYPLFVQVDAPVVLDDGDGFRAIVIGRWSEMDLDRRRNVWGFEDGQVRGTARVELEVPEELAATNFYVTYAMQDLPFDHDGFWRIEAIKDWRATKLIVGSTKNGRTRFTIDIRESSRSKLLSLFNRQAINWRGDARILFRSALAPLAQAFSCWLLVVGILWFKHLLSRPGQPTNKITQQQPELEQLKRVNGLDHLRGIAILMVYGYHSLYATFGYDQLGWNGWYRNLDHPTSFLALAPLTFGSGGVAVFFALSGFCIHLSYMRSPRQSWFDYFWRRAFRIYPPFFVALLFFAFVLPSTRFSFVQDADFTSFVSQVFLIFNLNKDTYWAVNGSFWSVAVEVQLYLLYPFLLLLVYRFGWVPILILTIAIEIGLKFVPGASMSDQPITGLLFAVCAGALGYVFSWLIGAKVADDYLAGCPLFLRQVPIWCWLGLLLTSLLVRPLAFMQFPLFSLTTIGFIILILRHPELRFPVPVRISQHLALVGTASYSFYLLHQPLLNLAPQAIRLLHGGEFVHPVILFAGCILVYPPIVGASWLMYCFVEVPSIDAGKRFVASPKQMPELRDKQILPESESSTAI